MNTQVTAILEYDQSRTVFLPPYPTIEDAGAPSSLQFSSPSRSSSSGIGKTAKLSIWAWRGTAWVTGCPFRQQAGNFATRRIDRAAEPDALE